jgi:glycosyltransferase involved in cell wall biosynthesis
MKACALLSSKIPSKITTCSVNAGVIHTQKGYDQKLIQHIPNGFDIDLFKSSSVNKHDIRTELNLNFESFVVGFIGRYDPQKNHEGFIKSAKKIIQEIPNVEFVLAGSMVDERNAHLKCLIEELGLSDYFHLLGERNDIPRLMNSLDVLVSFSNYGEAFPNVLGEAMSSAIPCIVTDVGDSVDIVGDTGFVVERNNVQELCDTLCSFSKLSKLQKNNFGQKARARVEKYYDIENVVIQYQDMYLELLKR